MSAIQIKIRRNTKKQENNKKKFNQLKLAQIFKIADKNIKTVIKPIPICSKS